MNAGTPARRLAVVIPYFQRKPGLLLACVRSIQAQRGVPPCQVIVVDDSSPLPASHELQEVSAQSDVQVLLQPNAGPGAARNRGLDHVAPGTEYVAFLDSDDCWHPWFAADAMDAMDRGPDMFFANSQRYGHEHPRFDWGQAAAHRLDPAVHHVLDAERGLYRYDGDFFDFAVHRSGIISTSTLAYRFAKLPQLRFTTELFNGQDRFFKLQLSKAARACAFSTRVSAVEGEGINIFDSSQWGSGKSLTLLHSYIKLSRMILQCIELDAAQRRFVQGQLEATRQDLAVTVLHMLRAGTPIQRDMLRRTFQADPMSAWMFMPNVARAGWRKLRARA